MYQNNYYRWRTYRLCRRRGKLEQSSNVLPIEKKDLGQTQKYLVAVDVTYGYARKNDPDC